jgi:hypothetical protein
MTDEVVQVFILDMGLKSKLVLHCYGKRNDKIQE